MSQSGDVETPPVKTQLPKSDAAPPMGRALETGSRTYPRPVLPKFKLRLMLAAHISSGCCTKASHTDWLEGCCAKVSHANYRILRVNALRAESAGSCCQRAVEAVPL